MSGGFYKLDANAFTDVLMFMMRRILLTAVLLATASAAQASWWPAFSANYVQLVEGQTTTIEVRAMWSGLVDYGWTPFQFTSDEPQVARVTGGLEKPTDVGDVKIEALRIGTAWVRLRTQTGDWCCGKFVQIDVLPNPVEVTA
ncbi:MAG: hypothetical protein ACLGH0_12480, partial [Thermoanaerobaculia bacterium]